MFYASSLPSQLSASIPRGSSARDLTFDLWRVGVVVSERVHLPFSPLSLEAAHRLLLLTPLEASFLTTFYPWLQLSQ